MPKSHPPYPPEFRTEAVRLVRSGERTPEGLARDLGCSAQAIRTWARQAVVAAAGVQVGLAPRLISAPS